MKLNNITLVALGFTLVLTSQCAASNARRALQNTSVDVVLGGDVVMKLSADADGQTAQDLADSITDRLATIVAVPDLHPSDVVVYQMPRVGPVIYVLGRKLMTVDEATARATGLGSPMKAARILARRLQIELPQADIRLPDKPAPKIPVNPSLLITKDLNKVGGNVGSVIFRDHVVMQLRGLQPGGQTSAERADMLTTRINMLAHCAANHPQIAVSEAAGNSATLMVGGRPLYTATTADARAGGKNSARQLASCWADNIRNAMAAHPRSARGKVHHARFGASGATRRGNQT